MGNDGNEYKVITQVFLYKFLNDKFGYEIKNARSEIAKKIKTADKWETAYAELSDNERMLLQSAISPDVPMLEPYHLISNLWNQQGKGDFDIIFDNTMTDIAEQNADIFSTQTTENTKIPLFETLSNFVTDSAQRAPFARALVDKLVNFSFEEAFTEHYDFFAQIFEYLIKDYNTAGGGKYAEYYTPHAIATIMARLLVGDNADLHSMECYDPSAGTGTLLMALGHQIGEDRCTIFSQDISQRSNKMLKLNLLLNGLVSSLDNAIQGDTLVAPYHKSDDGQQLQRGYQAVSRRVVLEEDDVPRLLAADAGAQGAHLLEDVAVAHLGGDDVDALALHGELEAEVCHDRAHHGVLRERAAPLHVLGADREDVVSVDDGAVRRHREQAVGVAVMRERDIGAGLLQQLDDGLKVRRTAPDVDVRAVWLGVDGEHLGAQFLEGSRRRPARRAVRAVERHLEPREVDALRADRVDGMLDVALRGVFEHDRRLGRGNLLAAHLLDNHLQLVFERVGQLVAVRVEELDAVVLGRIVACRDDDAAIDVGLAREQGNCRCRDASRDHGLAAFGADARHECVFEHRA